MTIKGLEDKYLRSYYKWLQSKRWDTNYYHVANELPGKNLGAFSNNLKLKGKKKGWSDISILESRHEYGHLYIELKTDKGSASFEQLAFLHNRNNNGDLGVVAFGLEAAIKITEWYMTDSTEPLPVIYKDRKRGGHTFENVLEVVK